MEIHPPHPVHSIGDFLREIVTITTGILIALSLETAVTALHHRSLVREAKANLAQEIRTNRSELDTVLVKSMARLTKEQDEALAIIEAIRAKKSLHDFQLSATYNIASLNATAWTTAQSTGAVSLMDYAEIKRLAALYDLQSRVGTIQDRLVEAYVTAGPPGDPTTITADELRQWRQRVVLITANLSAARGLATALLGEYDKELLALGNFQEAR
jgi:hypothetical protein